LVTLFTKAVIAQPARHVKKSKHRLLDFLALLSSPARNALLHYQIDTIEKLSALTEKEVLSLHGIGKASLPILRKSLAERGLTFKQAENNKSKT